MKKFSGLDEFAAAEGSQLGPTEWLEVTQDRVNLFADATDDHQWIHVDPERAANGPFGGTIAHGLLTLSLLPHFTHQLYTVDNIAMAINYGYNKVRFITPVRVGAKIRARAEIAKVDQLDGAVQATRDHHGRDRGFRQAGRRCRVDRPLSRLRRCLTRVDSATAISTASMPTASALVDRDRGSRDVFRLVAGQPAHRVGDVFGLGRPGRAGTA